MHGDKSFWKSILNEYRSKISFDLWKESLRTITLSNWSRHIKILKPYSKPAWSHYSYLKVKDTLGYTKQDGLNRQTDRWIRITQHNYNFFVLYPLFTKHQTECEKLLLLVLKALLNAAAWELCPPYFYCLLVHVTTERHVQENQLGTARKNTARRF